MRYFPKRAQRKANIGAKLNVCTHCLGDLFADGLCVQCHVDIQQDPAHIARGGDCWRSGCHVAIHGSNHSSLFFVE